MFGNVKWNNSQEDTERFSSKCREIVLVSEISLIAISWLLAGDAIHGPCSMLRVALPPRKLHRHVSLRSKRSDKVPIIFACQPSVIVLTRCVTSLSMTFGALNHVLTSSKCWLMKQHCCNGHCSSSHSMLDTGIPHSLLWLRNRESHWFKVTPLCRGGTPSALPRAPYNSVASINKE